MSKILIIEDEEAIADLEKDYLELSGFEVEIEERGDAGLTKALKEDFDLIILDLMLPGVDGFEICKKIREEKDIPVIMVSAKKDDIDKIRGLGLGADDYMTKPFSIAVLKLRLAKLLDRNMEKEEAHILRSGDIVLDQDLIKVWKENQEMECSVTEYRILKYFLENKNQVLTQNQILEAVWDLDGKFVNPNTLQVNIGRLRKKIEKDPSSPRYIKTIRGIGYIWEE